MTKAARIPYDDMLRAMKAIKAAGIEKARIVMHLNRGEIEILIGEVKEPIGRGGWEEE